MPNKCFPCFHGTVESPSGHLPSNQERPRGSHWLGILAAGIKRSSDNVVNSTMLRVTSFTKLAVKTVEAFITYN